MVAPAVGAGVYIGGAILVGGAAYLVTPAGQRTAGSLGDAMGDAGASAVDSVVDLFSSEDEETNTTTDDTATTDTATTTCPPMPYFHYTNPPVATSIMATRSILPGASGFVYLTQGGWGPKTVWYELFIVSPYHADKCYAFVNLSADCTVPIAPKASDGFLFEFVHSGVLHEHIPNVTFIMGGANNFPEHPNYADLPGPPR